MRWFFLNRFNGFAPSECLPNCRTLHQGQSQASYFDKVHGPLRNRNPTAFPADGSQRPERQGIEMPPTVGAVPKGLKEQV